MRKHMIQNLSFWKANIKRNQNIILCPRMEARQLSFVDTSACVCVQSLSRVWLFVTPWTVAHQASLSMGFSRLKYWSGLSFPSPGDLPDPGIEHVSPVSPALAGGFFTTEPPESPRGTMKGDNTTGRHSATS